MNRKAADELIAGVVVDFGGGGGEHGNDGAFDEDAESDDDALGGEHDFGVGEAVDDGRNKRPLKGHEEPTTEEGEPEFENLALGHGDWRLETGD